MTLVRDRPKRSVEGRMPATITFSYGQPGAPKASLGKRADLSELLHPGNNSVKTIDFRIDRFLCIQYNKYDLRQVSS